MNGNVKCQVHGEHGNLSNGKCWYCVQSGLVPPGGSLVPIERKKVLITSTIGRKRKIA